MGCEHIESDRLEIWNAFLTLLMLVMALRKVLCYFYSSIVFIFYYYQSIILKRYETSIFYKCLFLLYCGKILMIVTFSMHFHFICRIIYLHFILPTFKFGNCSRRFCLSIFSKLQVTNDVFIESLHIIFVRYLFIGICYNLNSMLLLLPDMTVFNYNYLHDFFFVFYNG